MDFQCKYQGVHMAKGVSRTTRECKSLTGVSDLQGRDIPVYQSRYI